MKNLEKIRKDSREIKDKIDDTEERLRQLKNQEQKILKQDIVKRRKERTHRLMTRGAILESLIENTVEVVNDEYGIDLSIEIDKAIKRGEKESIIEKIKEYKKIVIALIKKDNQPKVITKIKKDKTW